MSVSTGTPGTDALVLRGVGVRYGATYAVRGVDLSVRPRSITALLGPSGCGKTSLLHALNRLHDLDPVATVEGEIALDGAPIASLDAGDLRRRVGLLFQKPSPFPLSIRENLAFPLRAHATPRAEIPGRIEDALRRAALWEEVRDRLSTPATALSGGQQQRLCLARAIALEPEVLLLDEPCSALDTRATALVEATLRVLSATTAILIVTHNLAQARRLATRCVCLWPTWEGGRIVDDGPIARVFGEPATRELGDWLEGRTG